MVVDRFDEMGTTTLLALWYAGDREALEIVMGRHLSWIHERVQARMGPHLAAKTESQDVVQDALMRFLRYGTRIQLQNESHLRGLLVRIVENVLRDTYEFWNAELRQTRRDCELANDVVLNLDARANDRPDECAARAEEHAILQFALTLLSPDEREVVLERDTHRRTYAEIGQRFGISAAAAESRYRRAAAHLTLLVLSVRARDVPQVLRLCEDDSMAGDDADASDGPACDASP